MQRFWSKVKKTKTCWLWKASTRRDGYGQFKLNGKMVAAHRLSYTITFGNIPNNLQVLHSCDVRNCVKPAHFFLGDNNANIKDRMQKGRSKKLSITDAARKQICKKYRAGGVSQMALAKQFGISQTSVCKLVKEH